MGGFERASLRKERLGKQYGHLVGLFFIGKGIM
jgi:hypothetical protein